MRASSASDTWPLPRSAKMACFNAASYGRAWWRISFADMARPVPVIATMATSMPSALVPLIAPAIRGGLSAARLAALGMAASLYPNAARRQGRYMLPGFARAADEEESGSSLEAPSPAWKSCLPILVRRGVNQWWPVFRWRGYNADSD